ncbi:MAG: transketolase, partial [Pseudomonadota bacterium]
LRSPPARGRLAEPAVAMEARDLLQDIGIGVRVVSMPCWEIFAQTEESYRRRVLPGGPVRVAIEAGVEFGWDRWLYGERGKREKAAFVGMQDFGASAPAGELFRHFQITAQATAEKVKELIGL